MNSSLAGGIESTEDSSCWVKVSSNVGLERIPFHVISTKVAKSPKVNSALSLELYFPFIITFSWPNLDFRLLLSCPDEDLHFDCCFLPTCTSFPCIYTSLSPGSRAHGQYRWLWFQKPFLFLFLSRLILPLTPSSAEAVVVHTLRPFHWHVPNFHYSLVCWWQQMELTVYGTLLERRAQAVWFLLHFYKCSINCPVFIRSVFQ